MYLFSYLEWFSYIIHKYAPYHISPNEVFGDIMVLASPPPPVDPDDVNTLNSKHIQPISFKFYMRVDTPLRYFAIEIDTLRWLEQLRSLPNDTRIPQIFKLQYLHK